MATPLGRFDDNSLPQRYLQGRDGLTHQTQLSYIPPTSQVNQRPHTRHHGISSHTEISHEGTGIHDETYFPDGVTPASSIYLADSFGTLKSEGTEPEVQDEPKVGLIGGTEDATASGTEDESYIDPEGRTEIHSIAARNQSFTMPRTRSRKFIGSVGDLERQDTLAGVEIGNPVLDPNSPEFDIYKWVRMFMKLLQEENIKSRRTGFTVQNLNVSGSGNALQLQKDILEPFMVPFRLNEYVSFGKKTEKHILRNIQATLGSGHMLIVLGRPGSGCSTFLKTVCGEHHGLNVQKGSEIHYNGIPQDRMMKEFKGEVIYNQEVDKHFPHLTVWETLTFAASARTPQHRVQGLTRKQYIEHTTNVVMSILGLRHTRNTKVGNDYIRGVSGGERKRVSIAEMALAGSPVAAWDNSTRGLDAASALEFTKALKVFAKVAGACQIVAIYQASQAIYDLFDKAIVLYEGRQIYYGRTDHAKRYFEEMGWYCPPRQTTGDYLTSVTNPSERQAKEGHENRVPRTPDEFEKYWQASEDYAALQREIERTEKEYPIGQGALSEFEQSHRQMQAKHTRPGSPFVISIFMQVRLCMKRFYQRAWNDKASTLTSVIVNIVMALIIGSIFFGTQDGTSSFYSRGSVLFLAVLLNALMAVNEINSLYAQRPIVEKQASYAFYHPFAEALAGIIADIPIKFFTATCFNIILYFLAGLRRTPSHFFIFFLFNFLAQLCMTCIFRTLGAATKTVSAAMSYAGVFVLAIVIYTGFTIPGPYMHPWFSWLRHINPVGYGFEALLVNEVHGRTFPCSNLVPSYPNMTPNTFICSTPGSVLGQTFVSGDAWVQSAYNYSYSHIWRNLGIIIAFLVFFLFAYLLITEFNSATSSSAEFLIFRRRHVPTYMLEAARGKGKSDETGAAVVSGEIQPDQEKGQDDAVNVIPPQKHIFTWRDVVYDIPVKEGQRRLLDHVSGWVKPGTLTALMGISGAGKTTLLDVLAQRVSIGIVTGDMLVNGKPLDPSFQRKTGYVQQQDLHLTTSTVREALRFSAMLRQPKSVSKKEKYDYVEDVIKMLDMESFAKAVIGQPGEGLNVEQRKLLTIGVELAAKPALLLFLDEPTSGLDSQSSWAIVGFLRKLANNGQAVLATIHQPSAILFQRFDRLLFLAKGGRTVYFGDVGENSHTLLDYFERNGSCHCEPSENPAEFMLEIVGAGASGKSTKDWHEVWTHSPEADGVQQELDRIHEQKRNEAAAGADGSDTHSEFAMPFTTQLYEVTGRVFQQYWRTPSYIWGKLLLGIVSALFVGFSFYKSNTSQQGLQNLAFAVFMMTTIFSSLVQQIMPLFVTQRSLYEVRERPSKAYDWKAFLLANIVVEIPFQIFLGITVWAAWLYPIFSGDGIPSPERQGLSLLFVIMFFVFASTFAQALIAGLPDAETAGSLATFLFSMTLIFNGVVQAPNALPQFWIFMYRVSPLTYLVGGLLATGAARRPVNCASNEFAVFNPPSGQTCGAYVGPYAAAAGGNLLNPLATTGCKYCSISSTDQYLASVGISWDERWRNFGIMWAFVVFNIAFAVFAYYTFRVARWNSKMPVFGKLLRRGGEAKRPVRKTEARGRDTLPLGGKARGDLVRRL